MRSSASCRSRKDGSIQSLNSCSCLVDMESCQRQVETDKKAVDELIRERDNLNKVDLMAAQDKK